MKSITILAACAVAFGGTAFAQSRDTSRTANERAQSQRVPEVRAAPGERPGVVDRARQGAKRATGATRGLANRGAERLRETGKAIERRLPGAEKQAAERTDTRTAGVGPSDVDRERRDRMDEAYANWKQQQQGNR